jgi:hypothetical protein
MMNRRTLLITTALGATGIAVAGCSTTQIATFEAEWATVAGQVQNAVSIAAKYVPTIESIAATAASLFGPQYVVLVTAGSAAFNQVVQALVSVVANLTPPASARLMVRLRASSPNVPVTIGVTAAGVKVTGWQA